MDFCDELELATADAQEAVLSLPLFRQLGEGGLDTEGLHFFLWRSHHVVRELAPLLMACGARLGAHHAQLREEICHYLPQCAGRHELIVEDLVDAGFARARVIAAKPDIASEVLIAYAWDVANRRDPVGVLGLLHVLEGSVGRRIFESMADQRDTLGLFGPMAFCFESQDDLDEDLVLFSAELVSRIVRPDEQAGLVHASRCFHRLYADLFRDFAPLTFVPGRLPSAAPRVQIA